MFDEQKVQNRNILLQCRSIFSIKSIHPSWIK